MQAISKKEFSPLEDIRFATDDLHMLLADFRRTITEIDDALFAIDSEIKKLAPRPKADVPEA